MERRSDGVDGCETKTFQFPRKQQIMCPQEFRGICLKTWRRCTYFYFIFYVQTSETLSKFPKFLFGNETNKERESLMGVKSCGRSKCIDSRANGTYLKSFSIDLVQNTNVSELVSPTQMGQRMCECESAVCCKSIPTVRQQ